MAGEKLTPARIVIDSDISLEEALRRPQTIPAPQEILDQQDILSVLYYSFDGHLHQGQIVVNRKVAKDIEEAFGLIKKIKFPVGKVAISSTVGLNFEDQKMALSNLSGGFNYRHIAKTNKLSNHAFGLAIDINPAMNPYIRGDYKQPEGVEYNPEVPGTITAGGPIVAFFKERGWEWGGDWTDRKDYMHFEKP